MPRPVLLTLALLGACLLTTSDGHGSCMYTPLEAQVRRAELVFAGTVRRAEVIHSSWDGLLGGSLPNSTRFVFEDIRYAKGTGPSDSVALIQMGGGHVFVSEQVSFQLGNRYIVLAVKGPADQSGSWTSMVCGEGHPFTVWPDSGESQPVVRVAGGNPFVVFDSLHAVVLSKRSWSTDLADWKRYGPPQPPARRSSDEVLRDLDSLGEFEGQPRPWSPDKPRHPAEGIRWARLFPHQDTGKRITEEQMLRTLAAIATRPPLSR